ncbi:hypothetical protein RchiOBHm_Chr4g0436431 [Rosa chinensis]|uniref:Uncharacterized protein n=1 Tax=Rosa chinensis TaxID=74649 RepID=A0A2P6R221_ROSCH|nr:uncharacterized protein LOC112196805 [Rosa chinensis]PRQ40476.1 hypothetical protein RchiOBHm_Chr4g0436431 [Rosa chinensis]
MEDCNVLAADCVVISCCCQCLILQITIFIFFKLPCKLIRKTREYTMKKLQQRRRKGIVVESKTVYQCENDIESIRESMRSVEDIHSCRSCIEEVDKVLEELYQRGEFGFGSFWGGGELGFSPTHHLGEDDRFDPSFVRYQLIEMIESVS